jgi:phage shock protein C
METAMGKAKNKLYRSRSSFIGGVCAGLADFFDLDPIVMRVLAVLVCCTTLGVGGFAYVIMWIALPLEPDGYLPYDVEPESVQSSTYGHVDADKTRGRLFGQLSEFSQEEGSSTPARLLMGVGLILLFLGVSQVLGPMVKGTSWWQYWPLVLIISGLAIIVVPIAREWTQFWHLGGAVLVLVGWVLLPVSVGFFSSLTLVVAFNALWPLVLASIALFAFASFHRAPALALLAVVLFGLFCLSTLTTYAIPGPLSDLVVYLPDGSSRLLLRGPGL